MFACFMGFSKIAELILQKNANLRSLARDPVYWAAKGGHLDTLKLLIDAGGDVNGNSTEKETPAMVACRYGFEEIVAYLLEHGADFTKSDAVYWGVLMVLFFG
jgi:ankyrin repeat protein